MLEFLKCSYSHHPNRTYSGPLSSNGSVLSDGFLFVLVLYLLADVYLDASPLLAPYLGRSSKPFLEVPTKQLSATELQNIQEQGTYPDPYSRPSLYLSNPHGVSWQKVFQLMARALEQCFKCNCESWICKS